MMTDQMEIEKISFYKHPGNVYLDFVDHPELVGLTRGHCFPKRMSVAVGETVAIGNPVYATDHLGRRVDVQGVSHPSSNLSRYVIHSLSTDFAAGFTLQKSPTRRILITGNETGRTTFRFFPALRAKLIKGGALKNIYLRSVYADLEVAVV